MRSSFPRSGLYRWIAGGILLVSLAATACGPEEPAGPIVLEVGGGKISLDQLRTEFDNRQGVGAFDLLPLEDRKAFLQTIGDKEVLLRLSRDKFDGLAAPYDRFLRESSEARLVDALEKHLSDPPSRDSAGVETMLDQFNKEILVSWIINPSDSLINVARERILAGDDIEEVVRRYSKEDPEKSRLGREVWRSGAGVTQVFIEDLFLNGNEPGFVSEARRGPMGFELFRIDEMRETDIRKNEPATQNLRKLARMILISRRIDTWADSLKEANSLLLHEEALPILSAGMQEYWDSLAAQPEAGEEVATAYEPPLSYFAEDELDAVLYEVKDGPVTISEFLKDLRAVPMNLWPSGKSSELDRSSVEKRIHFAWQLRFARSLGLHEDPSLIRLAEIDEEKFLIEQIHNGEIVSKISVTDEDIDAYYEENKESYLSGDVIRFSYIVFPTKEEAQEFSAKGMEATGTWWVSQMSAFRRERPDIQTVPNTEDYDLTQPIPEEVRGMVEVGRDKGVTDVLEAVPFPPGGWVVGRVIRREVPGYRPVEKMRDGLRMVLTNQATAREMENLIDSGRKSLNLKLYPENLGAPDTLGTGAAS